MSQAGVLNVAGSSPAIPTSFVTDSGIAIPVLNILNVLGTAPISTTGSGNTVGIELATPLEVQYGGTGQDIFPIGSIPIGELTSPFNSLSPGGAGTIVRSNGPGVDPAYSNASYPSGAAAGDLIYGSALNAYSQLGIGSAGQILTVNSGFPTWTTTPGATAWVDVVGTSQALAVNTGYIADNAGLVTFTLPATAAQFSIIEIVGNGAGGWIIAQNANQRIIVGSSASTIGVGGSVASTNANDTIRMIAVVGGASTIWKAMSLIGNLTIV
jgi:hypothetical protein